MFLIVQNWIEYISICEYIQSVLFIFKISIAWVAVRLNEVWKKHFVKLQLDFSIQWKEFSVREVGGGWLVTLFHFQTLNYACLAISFHSKKCFFSIIFWNFWTVHLIPTNWTYSRKQPLFHELKLKWNRLQWSNWLHTIDAHDWCTLYCLFAFLIRQ